jgi:CoA:oxalate CoA-transferase
MNQEADRESMWRLIEGADVMVTNFRAGVAEKFGFGQPEVLARNPEIIYLACNGWGETGPMKDQGGADPQVQAFCGWCSITGPEGGDWEFLRFLGHIDMNSSVYIAAGVLTGLVARGRVGGQGIRLSMLEAALSMQSNRLSEYLAGGVTPVPLGSASAVVAPSQAFECQDGEYVAVSAETEAQWERLVEALGRPELAKDARFSTNGDRVQHRRDLAAELGPIFKGKPATWWNFVLSRARVPVSRFWDWDLIQTNPQVLQNEHVVKVDTGATGTVYTGGPPWKFEEAPAQIRRNPVTGEHTKEVLTELAAAPSRPKAPQRHEGGAPFAGLRVLEFASGLAGPHAGALLADLGAAVVKIETGDGDYIRQWGPPFKDGVGTAFLELNRNKGSRGSRTSAERAGRPCWTWLARRTS